MTNYVKSTNFASKDSLAAGNPLKIVKGTEIDTEFNNISTAVATKADLLSPVLTGTPTAPTASDGTNTTQIATTAFVIGERSSTSTLTNKSLTSPTLTGTPVAPTATAGTNTTQISTTAFVGTAIVDERSASVTLSNKTISSPSLTGTPVAPTAAAGTNTTQIATTAFVIGERSATATLTNKTLTSPTLSDAVLTGNPTAPTPATSDNDISVATTAFVKAALQTLYPVGSIYINASSATNPATLLGFGTWTEFGSGRVLVGQNASDALFDTLEETGGSKDAIVVSHTHTATVSDPGHTHTLSTSANTNVASGIFEIAMEGAASTSPTNSSTTGITVSNSTTGSSGTNANVQPYIVVKMWKRVS